ncbi:transposase [Streptomyces minutiscleroticus]|uniref:transposase n=1 Tax=Streptomyces minutiscleroticus TaxID=68238 RepID=UPI003571353A
MSGRTGWRMCCLGPGAFSRGLICGAGPAGAEVLVVDKAGFAKKGHVSAGVDRQFTGSLGGGSPCQVGVMAAWATGAGQALIDRELHLPQEWTRDRARCRAAHVPDAVGSAVEPRQAERLIDRILSDLPQGQVWVAADEVYGRDGAFRTFLESRELSYAADGAGQPDGAAAAGPAARRPAGRARRPGRGLGAAARGPLPARQPPPAVVGTAHPRPGHTRRRRSVGPLAHHPTPPGRPE